MTLKDWEKAYNGTVVHHDGKTAVSLMREHGSALALYELSDYKVSSVIGGVVWMVPVKPIVDLWACKKCGAKYNSAKLSACEQCGTTLAPAW